MSQTDEVRYNVVCANCGGIWQPLFKSPLWWQAKQRAEKGYIDALYVGGEKCGCEKKVVRPEAPFRVLGYDGMCEEYDIPFNRFADAVKAFKKFQDEGDVVFITGVSQSVQEKLQWA